MKSLTCWARNFLADESGVTMVEYGLIAGLISIVCIIALTGVGGNLNELYKVICTKVSDAVTSGGGTGLGCS